MLHVLGRRFHRNSLLAMLFWGIACTRGSETPEERVERYIREGVQAAQEKRIGDVFEHVAKGFRGPRGADLRESKRMVAGQLLRPGWLGVFAPLISVKQTEATRIEATVQIIVVRGQPIKGVEDLLPTQGDRFELKLVASGPDPDWVFTEAEVRRRRR